MVALPVPGDDAASGAFTVGDADAENDAGNLGVFIVSTSRTAADGRPGITDAEGDGTGDARTVVARYAGNADGVGNAANQPGADDPDVGVADSGDTTVTIKGAYGTLTYRLADHGWTYALGNGWDAVQRLDAADRVDDIFAVTFTDARGRQVTVPVTISVTGTNDAPVIVDHDAAAGGVTSNLRGAVSEGAGAATDATVTGRIVLTDVDQDDDPSDFTFAMAGGTSVTGTVEQDNVVAENKFPDNSGSARSTV